MPPLVSLVIVAWNSKAHLSLCLQKLSAQTFQDFEVIIIDNGSQDDAAEDALRRFPHLRIKLEKLAENRGFAAANNIGAKLATGTWLALLNADAYPEPDWLEMLMQAAQNNPAFSFFSSRQIQASQPHLLDGDGDVYHVSGLAWRRGYNLPCEKNAQPQEVFSPCGASALYLREEFLQAGGFDEDFFSYHEDVDLGFRLRLLGKRCLHVPQAVVHHVGSASTGRRSDFSVYYGYRNLIWGFYKNMPASLLFLYLPLHVVTILFFILYLSMRGQGRVIFRAVGDALRGLPAVIKKRSIIQSNRQAAARDLKSVMSAGLLAPYIEFLQRRKH